jgi:hypothetical protein
MADTMTTRNIELFSGTLCIHISNRQRSFPKWIMTTLGELSSHVLQQPWHRDGNRIMIMRTWSWMFHSNHGNTSAETPGDSTATTALLRLLICICHALLAGSCLAYYSALKMEAVQPSETSAHFYRIIRRYIPEERTFRSHHCENFKSSNRDICFSHTLTNCYSRCRGVIWPSDTKETPTNNL